VTSRTEPAADPTTDASAVDVDDVARLRVVVGRLWRLMNASVLEVGLTPTQLSILGTVARRGPIGIGELASLEGVNPTMLSRIVGKLDDAHLIARVAHPNDGRAVVVEATPLGHELNVQAQQQRSKVLAERIEKLSPARAAELLAALPALETLATR
jgi:DNA-binding MarR family transcriptional regulator